MRTSQLTFALLFIANCTFAQSHVKVTDLEIELAQQTYSAPVKNKSITGEKLSIAGEKFSNGLGVHALSILKIKLFHTDFFTAKIGVNDSKIDYTSKKVKSIPLTDGKRIFYHITNSSKQFIGVEGANGMVNKGSVIFKILSNRKEIYNSGIMRKGDKAKDVKVKVYSGLLELIVEDAGDGVSGDHAVWINPVINYFEIAPIAQQIEYQGEVFTMPAEISEKLVSKIKRLPEIRLPLAQPKYDWLLDNTKARANVYKTSNSKDIVISTG